MNLTTFTIPANLRPSSLARGDKADLAARLAEINLDTLDLTPPAKSIRFQMPVNRALAERIKAEQEWWGNHLGRKISASVVFRNLLAKLFLDSPPQPRRSSPSEKSFLS